MTSNSVRDIVAVKLHDGGYEVVLFTSRDDRRKNGGRQLAVTKFKEEAEDIAKALLYAHKDGII